jgi:hypothetical protein
MKLKNFVVLFFSLSLFESIFGQITTLNWIFPVEQGFVVPCEPSDSGIVYQKQGKFFYKSKDNIEEIVGADSVKYMYNNLVYFEKNELKGIWKPRKGILFPPLYDELSWCTSWALKVSKYGMESIVDINNKVLVPWQSYAISGYDATVSYGDTILEVKYPKTQYFTKKGITNILPKIAEKSIDTSEVFYQKVDNVFYVLDKNKEIIKSEQFSNVYSMDSDVLSVEKGKKYGMMAKGGEWLVKPIFDDLSYFRGFDLKIYRVRINKLYGLINGKGEYLIQPEYLSIQLTDIGFVLEDEKNQKGFVSFDLKQILQNKYKDIQTSQKKYLLATNAETTYLFDNQGNTLPSNGIKMIFWNNIAKGYTKGVDKKIESYGLIDSSYQWVFPAILSSAPSKMTSNIYVFTKQYTTTDSTLYPKDLLRSNSLSKCCLIDTKGKIVQGDLEMESVTLCKSDIKLLLFKTQKRYGLLDENGKILLPAIYNEITIFKQNWIVVKEGDKVGLVQVTKE